MKKFQSLKTGGSAPTPPVMPVPGLEMRVIDPRRLGQALKRFCTGKLVELSDLNVLPGRHAQISVMSFSAARNF
jgi:hypothetical protein